MNDVINKLYDIHNNLKINYGSLKDEYPEQILSIMNLKGDEKILEIGGNIGRNTLVIASILENDNNLLTLESDDKISQKLIENKNINNFNFNVESSALSKRKLIQSGWTTKISDVLLEGFKNVNTICLDELNNRYKIIFDTLILDCEGAFYYILLDMPEILNNINLIIVENDYIKKEDKLYVDKVLLDKNFYLYYVDKGGKKNGPLYNNFYEVWKKYNT